MAVSLTMLLWTDADSGDGLSLQFDVTTTETKDDSVDITDHPVEVGSNVADNARDAPALITLEAIVSETPNPQLDEDVSLSSVDITVFDREPNGTTTFALDIPTPPIQFSESGLLQAGIGAIKGALFGAPKATAIAPTKARTHTEQAQAYQQTSDRNRVRDVYDKLLLLKSQHVMLDLIQTAYRDYTDMMVARVSQPRALGDGRSAKFQIDFKQITIASSQVVAAPKPSVVRGNTTKSKGSQGAKPADKAADKQSLAKDVAQYFGNLLHSGP